MISQRFQRRRPARYRDRSPLPASHPEDGRYHRLARERKPQNEDELPITGTFLNLVNFKLPDSNG
jgi:hypothetical protein